MKEIDPSYLRIMPDEIIAIRIPDHIDKESIRLWENNIRRRFPKLQFFCYKGNLKFTAIKKEEAKKKHAKK